MTRCTSSRHLQVHRILGRMGLKVPDSRGPWTKAAATSASKHLRPGDAPPSEEAAHKTHEGMQAWVDSKTADMLFEARWRDLHGGEGGAPAAVEQRARFHKLLAERYTRDVVGLGCTGVGPSFAARLTKVVRRGGGGGMLSLDLSCNSRLGDAGVPCVWCE